MKVARFDFQGRLDGVTRTPQGGIRATANLTRTGIFVYQTDSGEQFLEYRPKEEVFARDSLDTLNTAPLTVGHPSEVNTANWQELAVGHVIGGTVRENGKFVTAEIAIQDADTCAKVERGELRELSCGYEVDLEVVPGEHEGERYDAIQRNPRYNHVAIGGTDWGRAGRDVRIHLDTMRCSCGAAYADNVTTPINVKRSDAPSGDPLKRTDAPTNQDADNLRADLDASRKDNDRLRAERDSANVRADKAEAERDTAKKALDEAQTKQKEDEKSFDARVEKRVALISDARLVLGDDFDVKGKSDRDIRVAAIMKIDPKFDAKDKNDGYVDARFDLELPKVKKDRAALAQVNEGTSPAVIELPSQQTNDSRGESEVDKARREMNERNQNAWKRKS